MREAVQDMKLNSFAKLVGEAKSDVKLQLAVRDSVFTSYQSCQSFLQ